MTEKMLMLCTMLEAIRKRAEERKRGDCAPRKEGCYFDDPYLCTEHKDPTEMAEDIDRLLILIDELEKFRKVVEQGAGKAWS